MRIVLLGGAGYVGTRLAAVLRDNPDNDIIIAERNARSPARPADPRFSQVVMDWRDPESVRRARMQVRRADAIVHLAFPDSRSLEGAEAEVEKNEVRKGIGRLLDFAGGVGCRLFVHVSTAKVFGRKLPRMIDESTPVHPEDLYADLHRTAETALEDAKPADACARVSYRLTNSFGCPVDRSTSRWDLIVNEMCRSAITDESIRLGSGAGSWRDFVPMAHVVNVLSRELSVRATRRGHDTNWRAINLAAGRSMTIENMARRVQERAHLILGREVAIIPNPDRHGDAVPQAAVEVVFRSSYLDPLGDAEFEEMTRMEIDATLQRCVEWFG